MRHLHFFIVVAALLSAGVVSEARQAASQRPAPPSAPVRPQPPAVPQPSSPGMFTEARDARQTRERLGEVLEQHPPSLREVLRLDPTLLYNENYLATYPTLAGFLQQHPEVAHNPGFFIGSRTFEERNTNPQIEVARVLNNMVEGVLIVLVVMTITAGIVFILKTVIEHRRWQRAMRAQTELNTKLIDRFASSDELLAYLQTPQGRTLIELPVVPARAPRAMDAPLGRIFWSLQAGAVIAFGGAGILVAASRMRGGLVDLNPPLTAFGIVVLTVGIGFVISAAISYLLSQRLGLVQSVSARVSGEAPGS